MVIRFIFLNIFSLFFVVQGFTFTKCATSGIWVHPAGESLTTEGILIIEAYAKSQRVINLLNVDYPIFLVSDNDLIKLSVVEKCEGMASYTQAVLKPERDLTIGKIYKIRIDNIEERESYRLLEYNPKTRQKEWRSWEVQAEEKQTIIEHNMKPELIDNQLIQYGCGPANYMVFATGEKNNFKWIKTELLDLETEVSYTYYLKVEEDETLKVGHGMCGGAFRFTKDKKYKIRFRPMNRSGSLEKEWTDWVSVDA